MSLTRDRQVLRKLTMDKLPIPIPLITQEPTIINSTQ